MASDQFGSAFRAQRYDGAGNQPLAAGNRELATGNWPLATNFMNCADIDALLCDYVDGTLYGEKKAAVEEHLASCASCAELVRDSAGVVAFIERAAAVEPPAELLTRILFEIPQSRAHHRGSWSFWSRLKTKWIEPVLQPRFAMGMAMTILSFAMLGRFAGRYAGIEMRQIRPSDLNPVAIWTAIEDRALRTWERGVKYYENLRLVYEIQTRLKDWGDQAEADRPPDAVRSRAGAGESRAPSNTGGAR